MAKPQIIIDATAKVARTAIIGKKYRPLLTGGISKSARRTYLRRCSYVGEYAIVSEGCDVGENTILDDFTKLDPDVRVGERCLFIYSAHVCNAAIIGNDCIIGGFVGDSVRIGDNCRFFGKIVHKQDRPHLPWDDEAAEERAAVIEDNCFVGFQALIIGPVRLKSSSYVAAGAIVTKDVPARTVVIGQNCHRPLEDWKGSLKVSRFFKKR
jgi:acetyltransferase-like isoleucine patch superfamily enzyme